MLVVLMAGTDLPASQTGRTPMEGPAACSRRRTWGECVSPSLWLVGSRQRVAGDCAGLVEVRLRLGPGQSGHLPSQFPAVEVALREVVPAVFAGHRCLVRCGAEGGPG